MNLHVINRSEAWPTARPFISCDDLVIWVDTAGIDGLSAELKSEGLNVVCLSLEDGNRHQDLEFPVISDQTWVHYVLESTSLCSWG
jgi:hypothetical protein